MPVRELNATYSTRLDGSSVRDDSDEQRTLRTRPLRQAGPAFRYWRLIASAAAVQSLLFGSVPLQGAEITIKQGSVGL